MAIHRALFVGLMLAQQVAPQCGGGTVASPVTSPSATNTVPITVNAGPANNYFNGAFTSVTVCVPGTTNCQTIDGVLVDTGSSGLRILQSALTLSLPQETAANGDPIVGCSQFVDGFTWGPMQKADIKMASESASSVPIQVIGESGLPKIPTACSSSGPSEDTVDTLGANGVLGVGSFRQDCGPACTAVGSSNPALYYTCPSSGCVVAAVPATQQAQNPVWMFATDNNGVVIQLPSVATSGAASMSGTLVFGIGTQSNNALGSAKPQTLDAYGNFTTSFKGSSYSGSFIDSGSNGIFFLDSATVGIPTCADAADFYCPSTTQNLTANNIGANGTTTAINFQVANPDAFLNSSTLFVFGPIAGPNPGSFDWGLPFFYGRPVFTAIEGQSSPGGVGPYWAY